jgi:hypothetical protein
MMARDAFRDADRVAHPGSLSWPWAVAYRLPEQARNAC